MTVYKIKFITPEGEEEIECPNDVYILDAAEEYEDKGFGRGKWVIIDIDRHPVINGLIYGIQRIATFEEGRFIGEREAWHTMQTVTLEWVKQDDPRDGFHVSSEHLYGETRIIHQMYEPELKANGTMPPRWYPSLLDELD